MQKANMETKAGVMERGTSCTKEKGTIVNPLLSSICPSALQNKQVKKFFDFVTVGMWWVNAPKC